MIRHKGRNSIAAAYNSATPSLYNTGEQIYQAISPNKMMFGDLKDL